MHRNVLRIAAPSLALLGLAGVLTGCTKPTPGASVFSGTSSAYTEAMCWSSGGENIDAHACAQDMIASAANGGSAESVPVVPGDIVGISVDPVVAEAGWYPVIGGNALTKAPLTSTYFRFTYPELQALPEAGLPLMIVAGDNDHMRGIWAFSLIPAS